MRLRNCIPLLFIGLLAACQNPAERKQVQAFDQYLASLDQLEIPFNCNSNPHFELKLKSQNFNPELHAKFKYQWATEPLGILFQDSTKVLVVDLVPGDIAMVPVFMSYDLKGNKLDSLNPWDKSGWDPWYQGVEYLTVTKGRTIEIVDTVNQWSEVHPNPGENPKEATETKTGKSQYFWLGNGHFKES
ncbi:hypothetical protein [Croceimicrobium hydrocarbonivorans]|uniref:Lipoprotein n=1 Tax=Croceimicrobium hydrocarbonivorans TaxID=2761580 RepID=A0A7H0VA25_9FLAO|nr:hypothetical protein [Croceimicrobium hydrocarbonivorans]QNR22573.1 hypothetical protein H4K34_09245 [Croceimicrobium hydrocarbonivorans]